MRPKNLPIILCASIALTLAPVRAQIGVDPSDSFLDAFSTYQRAEKLEGSGNVQAAANAYKEAARKLEQISAQWPQWNPAIVEYRKKRTNESLVRLHEVIGGGGGGAGMVSNDSITGAGGLGGQDHGFEPPLPGEEGLIPATIPDPAPAPAPTFPPPPQGRTGGSSNPLQEIQDQLNHLQNALRTTREQLDEVNRQKEEFAQQLDESKKAQAQAEQRQKLLQTRADNAEAALMKALTEGAKESENVKKLQAEASKARKELEDIQIEREAAEEVRRQLADRLSSAHKRITTLSKERDEATKLSSESAARIAEARKQMDLAIKEKELLNEKLSKMTVERDDALAQVAKLKESQKQVDRLITENTQLMAKLADAEKQIDQFKADSVAKDQMITELKKEVGSVKQQLADTQKQSQEYQVEMADLKTKLETTAQQLAQMKSDSSTSETERKKMEEENELLRGIVLRQMKEQARRDQTRKLVLEQMSKLEGKSQDLLNKINYLGQPVVELSPKERALFKGPQIEITDTEISIAATKPETAQASSNPVGEQPSIAANDGAPAEATAASASEPAPAPASPEGSPSAAAPIKAALELPLASALDMSASQPANDLPAKDAAPAVSGIGTSTAQSSLPADVLPLAQEGKEHFERGNYREAEKAYEKILVRAPNNLYALSNLGVARFRSGKLQLAEEAFQKAIAIAPEDAFSHCTLGIVYYSQGKYDEAVNALTKALAINPKNATAHNYLGITASQKGWQEAALKELETATTLDPNYADAHFNLAVVFATQQPPNKENARRYYKRATELGAEPDAELEKLLK